MEWGPAGSYPSLWAALPEGSTCVCLPPVHLVVDVHGQLFKQVIGQLKREGRTKG